jgi:hypothetical protein
LQQDSHARKRTAIRRKISGTARVMLNGVEGSMPR